MSMPPEPVTGFCILPRSRTMSCTASAMRVGCAAFSCLNDAASMLRLSTSMSTSPSRSGSDGSSCLARCGNTPLSPTTRDKPYGSIAMVSGNGHHEQREHGDGDGGLGVDLAGLRLDLLRHGVIDDLL